MHNFFKRCLIFLHDGIGIVAEETVRCGKRMGRVECDFPGEENDEVGRKEKEIRRHPYGVLTDFL